MGNLASGRQWIVSMPLLKSTCVYTAAYGTDHILPKHHWLFDVACRLRCKDLAWFLVDCFVLERSHLTVRDRAEHIDNTSQYERSVLAGTLNKQLLALKSMVAASGALLDTHKAAMPGYPDARVANSMQAHGRHFSVGDIVLLGSRAGVVLACVQEGDAFFVIVEELALIEQITPQTATWRIGGARSLWLLVCLLAVQVVSVCD